MEAASIAIQVSAWEALQAALKDEDVDALSRVVAEALRVEHHAALSTTGTLKMDENGLFPH